MKIPDFDSIKTCSLCNNHIHDNFNLSGIRAIKNELVSYKICQPCYSSPENFEYTDETTPNRAKMWAKLDDKLKLIY